MNLSAFSGIITLMFTDKMDVSNYIERVNSDETTDIILPDSPQQIDIPCRVSFYSSENPSDKAVDNVPIKLQPKIFCGLGVELSAGDFINVRRYSDAGQLISSLFGKVGLPIAYATHKEASFFVEGSA